MYAYDGVVTGGTLSEEYQERAKWVTRMQVALGGYRLAQLLDQCFPLKKELDDRPPSCFL